MRPEYFKGCVKVPSARSLPLGDTNIFFSAHADVVVHPQKVSKISKKCFIVSCFSIIVKELFAE